MRFRVSWTVLGFFGLALGLSSARVVGDHHIPAGVTLNVRTLQTLDSGSAWSRMTVRAVVDEPIDLNGRIVLPRGAPARLEVVDVTRSPHLEGGDRIALRLLWIESRDRVSW